MPFSLLHLFMAQHPSFKLLLLLLLNFELSLCADFKVSFSFYLIFLFCFALSSLRQASEIMLCDFPYKKSLYSTVQNKSYYPVQCK